VVVEVPRTVRGFVGEQVAGMILFFVLALTVCLGSYLHAVRRKMSGFIVLWVGGIPLALWSIGGVFGGVLYLSGLWGGLGILSPALPAVVAMINWLVVRRADRLVGHAQ
jgi:hypothetical protein